MKDTNQATCFNHFGLNNKIIKALEEASFTTPTPVQNAVIPQILTGADIVAQAQTGTGKTAAFALPTLHMMDPSKGVQLVVMTPTRELARQVGDEIYRFGKHMGIRTVTVCGGMSFSTQLGQLKDGAQVIVATPGRLLDLLKTNRIKNFTPKTIVLDEADEMLDMGFIDDIKEIFSYLPEERQTLLFSATLSKQIQELIKKILKEPVFVRITDSVKTGVNIEQFCYCMKNDEREQALIRLIDSHAPEKSIVFCNTKKDVDDLFAALSEKGYSVSCLHGDMAQPQRMRTLSGFKRGATDILVATDVAARGLDVNDISHIFNYQMPNTEESYIHRIGRTGRAGKKGAAITLLTPKDLRWLEKISKINGNTTQLRPIPGLNDVKKQQVKKLIEDIKNVTVDDEVLSLIKDLKSEINPNDLFSGLVSLLLTKKKVSGPDKIGICPSQMNTAMKESRGNSYGNKDRFARGGKFKPRERDRSRKTYAKKY